MPSLLQTCLLASLAAAAVGELLQNGGFESTSHWDCWDCHCSTTSNKHSGQHAVQVTGRSQFYQGPSQYIQATGGNLYHVSGWVKMLNDQNGQFVQMEVDYLHADGSHDYQTLAGRDNVHTSDGWIHLQGTFTVPTTAMQSIRVYFQSGPSASVNFVVDEASITAQGSSGHSHGESTGGPIDQLRKSNINFHVTTASGINKADVNINVVQTKKSYPFGTAVNSWKYNANDANGKYRDFIHKHFNWIVPENALKWPTIEPNRGQKNYQLALDMIHGVRSHGIKVRGHNLVWSVDQFVQDWVKQLYGDDLRNVVKQHIQETMGKTQGLLEHWDVNNENLHGQWFQTRLGDQSYNLELFREAHQTDPSVKLFLNDYNVVANGASTYPYLQMAQQFKAANVGLSGIGVQCHFGNEEEPDTNGIKQRLDTLASVGVPIWVTELDVQAQDENRRADFYEKALTAFYSHPAVEGILFWGFWDQAHWRGEKAALVRGDNLQLTAAGRRVLDLFENQWMTDVTKSLAQDGNQFTVRGFHGDYQVHVMYQGRELTNLRKTFHLDKTDHTVNINVHT